jgi:hypothetical protein
MLHEICKNTLRPNDGRKKARMARAHWRLMMEAEFLKKLSFWMAVVQLILLVYWICTLWPRRKAREAADDPLGDLYVVPTGSVVLVEVKPGMHEEANKLIVDYCRKHFDRAFTFVPIMGRPAGGDVWAIKPMGIAEVLRPAEELGGGQQDPKGGAQGAEPTSTEKAP